MSRIACVQPSKCGVEFHIAGTAAARECSGSSNVKASHQITATPALASTPANSYEGAEFAEVQDADGNVITLIPGEITGSTRYVYRNGQCVALAAAISRRTGWPVVTREYEIKLGGETQRILGHAYALSPDGHIVDIDGALNWEGDRVKAWREEDVVTITESDRVDDLLDSFSHRLSEQNVDLAETFLDIVFEQYEADVARA